MSAFKNNKGVQRALLGGIAGFVLVAATATSTMAQLPADQQQAAQGQANPARVGEQFDERNQLRPAGPKIEVRDLVLQNMPPNAENIRFNLNEIRFEGVGAYTEAQMRPVYADKLGENVSLADIYAIATAMTNKYRNDGYILTQVIVPAQTIDGGVVTLRAVEGYVDNITVSGNDQESALNTIRGYANRIRSEGGALNVEDLEKFLLLINDLPGVEARSVLSPSATRTGASDLQIVVERDPYDAFLGIDNYGSRFLGPIQLTAAGAANSYFGNNERISAQFVMVPDNAELLYFSLGYDQPINTHGTLIKTTYSHSNTEPGYTLNRFDVNGKSDFASIAIEHPFLRSREHSLYGHAQFDARDVQSRNILEPTREDRIRALRIGGRYEFIDSLFSAAVNNISAQVSKGLDVLGASSKGDIRLSRPSGDPKFLKINAEAQRLQRLTSNVNLQLSARGQLANNALLASEEFGVGGINSGRGYDPSEITGDDGISGSVEVQWNEPYPVNYLEDYQLFGFYDIGKVWNVDSALPDDDDSLASAGFGVRADLPSNVKAGMSLAIPLTRGVQTNGTRNDVDPKVYFHLNKRF